MSNAARGQRRGILAVRLFYPHLVHLPMPNDFVIPFRSKGAIVRLIRTHVGLQLLDTSNSMIRGNTDADPLFGPEFPLLTPQNNAAHFSFTLTDASILDSPTKDEQLRQLAEKTPHYVTFDTRNENASYRVFQTRFFTEMMICFHARLSDEKIEKEQDNYRQIIDSFIVAYRHVAQDPKPRLLNDYRDAYVIYTGSIELSQEEYDQPIKQVLSKKREFNLSKSMYKMNYGQEILAPIKPQDALERLNDFFANGRTISVAAELLDRARNSLYQAKDFRYALLEAWQSAEILISEFLLYRKAELGADPSKLKEWDNEVSINYKINCELIPLLRDVTPDERVQIVSIDRFRKRRNDVIHRGAIIEEKEAQEVIATVASLHKIIELRQKAAD